MLLSKGQINLSISDCFPLPQCAHGRQTAWSHLAVVGSPWFVVMLIAMNSRLGTVVSHLVASVVTGIKYMYLSITLDGSKKIVMYEDDAHPVELG